MARWMGLMVVLALGCGDDSATDGGLDGGLDATTDMPVDGGGATEVRELAYDDWYETASVAPSTEVGGMVAVRFTAPAGSRLQTARFLLRDEGTPTTEFGVRVYRAESDGSPGEQLYPTDGTALAATAPWEAGMNRLWVDVNLPNLEVDGDFVIAMEWRSMPGAGSQYLTADESEPDGRTYVFLPSAGWQAVPFSTFPAADAMIHARIEVPVGVLPPEPTILTNAPTECTRWDALHADTGYENHLAASRIVPPSYPFRIDEVRVHSPHTVPFGAICNAALPYRVEVYVDSAATPAEDPEIVERFDVAIDEPDDIHHIVRLPLTTPVTLAEGEAMFVGVELPAESDESRACVQLCFDDWVDGRDFWSNAPTPPYPWVPVSDFDIQGHFNIDLVGEAL